MTLTFGISLEYPPFAEMTEAVTLSGFEMELGRALCNEIGTDWRWTEMDFDGLRTALQSRRVSAILASYAITAPRSKCFDFTQKYCSSAAGLLAKQGTNFKDLASLEGKTVGVLRDSTHEDFGVTILKRQGTACRTYASFSACLRDLQNGRSDAVLADAFVLQNTLKSLRSGYDFTELPLPYVDIFGDGMAIAVRKGDTTTLDSLNGALDALRANGTFEKLHNKYFS